MFENYKWYYDPVFFYCLDKDEVVSGKSAAEVYTMKLVMCEKIRKRSQMV